MQVRSGNSTSSPASGGVGFFIFAVLVVVKWYLFAVLICVYLMTNVLTSCCYIFFGKLSVQILCLFFYWTVLLNLMGAF